MQLFSLPNVTSDKITKTAIEKWKAKSWPNGVTDKPAFSRWVKDPETEWLFFSAYEGLTPTSRVSSANQAWLMHGLVVDYDMPVEEDLEACAEFVRTTCLRKGVPVPSLVCKTFSGGIRTIYEFEKPLLVHQLVHQLFLAQLTKDLRCRHVCQGLDELALKDLALFYCAPLKWHKIDAQPLQTSLLMHCILEASSKSNWRSRGAPAIPMHVLAGEVQARFPDRWQGPFDVGARGVRFWDSSADNPTAAIIRETGVQCFTGPKSFVPWGEIFGSSFTKNYEDSRVGGAIEETYFDGMTYWTKVNTEWLDFSRQDIVLQLRTRGLGHEVSNPGEMSEIEKGLASVQTAMRIEAAVPIPHFPTGINMIQNKRFLNISSAVLISPADACKKWGAGFPKLADYLSGFFEPTEHEGATQLDYFLAWLKRFYTSCAEKRPLPGQVTFIAGEVQSGKTFLSNVIIAKLMGGSADCSSYLLGETRFTGHLFAVPVWTIDDTRPGQDKAHANYSALIKKMPANQLFLYDDKFKRARMIPWLGRIMVSCNLDNESLRILPDVEQSLLDKICLYKSAPTREGYDFHSLDTALAFELPYFAKWLGDWDPPDSVVEASRFGVTSFHHPELLQAAREVTSSHSFYEAFHMFMRTTFHELKEQAWVGTASSMLTQMSVDDGMRAIVSHYTPRAVGRFIAQLVNQGVPLTQVRQDGLRMWSLTKGDFDRHCADSQQAAEVVAPVKVGAKKAKKSSK